VEKDYLSRRTTALLVGVAAFTVISTVGQAADGCGRGWLNNGWGCVPRSYPTALEPPQLCIGLHRLSLSQCHLSSLILHKSDYRFGDPVRRTRLRSQR
jgi:hypothetical protein